MSTGLNVNLLYGGNFFITDTGAGERKKRLTHGGLGAEE